MDILSKFSDEELTKLPFGLTRTQVFKLRKGLMTLADISPDLERKMIDRYSVYGSEAGKMDPANPDYTHPGFDGYAERFKALVAEVGLEQAYARWTQSHACGCMGAENGEPFCHCQMIHLTASRYATRSITPTDEGMTLLESIGQ